MYCRSNSRYVFYNNKENWLPQACVLENKMLLYVGFTQADSCFYFHRMILCTYSSASIICVYLHTMHFITISKLHKSVLFCPDDCTVTRMTLLLTSFFYRMWFFGAAYYWGTWVFLGVRFDFC